MFIRAQKTRSFKRGLDNLKQARTNPPQTPPDAYCRLARRNRRWVWIVDACPYCGRMHHHEADPAHVSDPHKSLGRRAPLCMGNILGLPPYVLVEALS